MSGTAAPKITGYVVDGATPVAAGANLRTKWNAYTGADEYRQDGRQVELADGTRPTNPPWGSWGRVTTASFSKGGLGNGVWEARVTARRGGSDIIGSTSDALAVRVGPVPVPVSAPAPATAPAPTPTPSPTPTTGTTTTTPAGVTPAELRRVGASTAADEVLVVRAGEIVVATRG